MPQAWPHEPQLAGSVFTSTQAPLQRVRPVAQVCWQVPALHVCPAGQTLPQIPQFDGSLEVSVQTVFAPDGHTCLGGLQTHCPAQPAAHGAQAYPVPQASPHPLQLYGLVAMSTQVGVWGSFGQNCTVGGEELQVHAPPPHQPWPQELPQPPQLAASVRESTHTPKQEMSEGDGQVQIPATQAEPALQVIPQAPQWSGSVRVSVQPWAQEDWPVGQDMVELLVQLAATPAATSATSQPRRAADLRSEPAIRPPTASDGRRTAGRASACGASTRKRPE